MANKVYHKYDSIQDFEKYINETPLNSVFRWEQLASNQYSRGFNKTESFQEALDLMKYGWEDMAKRLEKTINLESKEVSIKSSRRSYFDVAGFQASVPRYLQGIPTSMVNQKQVPVKQKVLTIVKHIGYLANVTQEEIVENSIKALMIVKKVEALGYRVNLDVISPAITIFGEEEAVVRIRVKSASERMNIAKVAFPLVHPDMLRRMVFRWREVCPEIKSKSWRGNYGSSIYDIAKVKTFLEPHEYYLHNFIDNVDAEVERMVKNK